MEDFKLIEGLADFASIAVENRFRQAKSQKSDKNYPAKESPYIHAA